MKTLYKYQIAIYNALKNKQSVNIGRDKLVVFNNQSGDEVVSCSFHNHPIVSINLTKKTVSFNTCNFKTVTTKARMNLYLDMLNIKEKIVSRGGVWQMAQSGQKYFENLTLSYK